MVTFTHFTHRVDRSNDLALSVFKIVPLYRILPRSRDTCNTIYMNLIVIHEISCYNRDLDIWETNHSSIS